MSFAVRTPTKFETQKVEAGLSAAVATERYDPRLLRRQFQSELPQTFSQLPVETLCFFFLPEAAHKIVCVSVQESAASTATLEHSFEPQIKRIVQVHIG